jgi:hypothetical protein
MGPHKGLSRLSGSSADESGAGCGGFCGAEAEGAADAAAGNVLDGLAEGSLASGLGGVTTDDAAGGGSMDVRGEDATVSTNVELGMGSGIRACSGAETETDGDGPDAVSVRRGTTSDPKTAASEATPSKPKTHTAVLR